METLNDKVAETQGLLIASEAREMGAVQTKLTATTARVAELHADLANQTVKVDGLAQQTVQSGVRAVAETFREDVLTADKGIVDVAWLRKGSTTDQMELLSREQSALLRSIKQQYAALRTNADMDGEK